VRLDTTFGHGTVIVAKGEAVGALPIVPSPLNVTASIDYHFALGGRRHYQRSGARRFPQPQSGPVYVWEQRVAVLLTGPSPGSVDERPQSAGRREVAKLRDGPVCQQRLGLAADSDA